MKMDQYERQDTYTATVNPGVLVTRGPRGSTGHVLSEFEKGHPQIWQEWTGVCIKERFKEVEFELGLEERVGFANA